MTLLCVWKIGIYKCRLQKVWHDWRGNSFERFERNFTYGWHKKLRLFFWIKYLCVSNCECYSCKRIMRQFEDCEPNWRWSLSCVLPLKQIETPEISSPFCIYAFPLKRIEFESFVHTETAFESKSNLHKNSRHLLLSITTQRSEL